MPDEKETLGEINHTNPYTGRTFGDTQSYGRGTAIAADGGEAEPSADDDDVETLADVGHTAPDDTDGAQRTFDRGDNR